MVDNEQDGIADKYTTDRLLDGCICIYIVM